MIYGIPCDTTIGTRVILQDVKRVFLRPSIFCGSKYVLVLRFLACEYSVYVFVCRVVFFTEKIIPSGNETRNFCILGGKRLNLLIKDIVVCHIERLILLFDL